VVRRGECFKQIAQILRGESDTEMTLHKSK
jgi:hypothetical protein